MAKPKGYRPPDDLEQQQIAERYAAGETFDVLCAEYGRGKPAIRKILKAAGVPVRPRGYGKDRSWTPEWRAAHKAGCSTPEFAQKSREALLERLPRMRGPATNTPIERRMQDALQAAGIGFTTQSVLLGRYLVDFEIRQAPIVIEADGAQHTLRDRKAQDAIRDADLIEAGYRVFRFTGSEINRDAAVCVQQVVDACGLLPESEPVFEIRTRFAGPAHPRWKGGVREYTCDTCGATFSAQPSHRKGELHYCSVKCAAAPRRGKALSPEHKARIGAGLAGGTRACRPGCTCGRHSRKNKSPVESAATPLW